MSYIKKLVLRKNFIKLSQKLTTLLVVVMTLAVSLYLHFGLTTLDTFSFLNYFFSILSIILLNFLPNKFLIFYYNYIKKNKILKILHNQNLLNFRSNILMLISIFLLFFISFLKLNSVISIKSANNDLVLPVFGNSFKTYTWYEYAVSYLKIKTSKINDIEHKSFVNNIFSRLERVLNLMLKRSYSCETELYDKWVNSYSNLKYEIYENTIKSNVSYFKSLGFFKTITLLFVHYIPTTNEIIRNYKEYVINNNMYIWGELVRSVRNFSMIYNIVYTILVVIPNEFISLITKILYFLNRIIFLDGVSMWLLWLVVTVSYVLSLNNKKYINTKYNYIYKKYYIYNTILDSIIIFMVICFLVKNIFIFFIAFEAILVPLFMYIIFQGSRLNKMCAVKYLVIYTVIGSIFLWFSVVYLLDTVGNVEYEYIQWYVINIVDSETRKVLFLSLFFGFAIKIPMVPFHHWLTIAHVEAPTNGSIILAALLLKVGTYGLYRFVYNLLPLESYFFSMEVSVLSLFGFTYATMLAIRQVDIKRYIAYTSIAHMNFSVLGLFSCTEIGLLGYIHTTVSHGIIATAMFYLIGHLYSVLNYRDTIRISGISQKFPKFSTFFFLFSMINMGLPLFSGFVGEFFIITSLIQTNEMFAVIVCVGFLLSGIYNIFQINKLIFSDNSTSVNFKKNEDLGAPSIVILVILMFWSFIFGVLPDILLKTIEIGIF